MSCRLEVTLVCTSPVLTLGLKQLLEQGPFTCTVRALACVPSDPLYPATDPAVVLLAPFDWQEFARWLPSTQACLGRHSWLLLMDPRIAGMFLAPLERYSCALVPPTSSPDYLWSALWDLAHAQQACLWTELLGCFVKGLADRISGSRTRLPSPAELQCGCAVSLGLCNRQIAEILHLRETTVKSHLHRLMQKLGLANRHELGLLTHAALCLSSSAARQK
jgi:DNA-binding CsgD family transcriptional regulator